MLQLALGDHQFVLDPQELDRTRITRTAFYRDLMNLPGPAEIKFQLLIRAAAGLAEMGRAPDGIAVLRLVRRLATPSSPSFRSADRAIEAIAPQESAGVAAASGFEIVEIRNQRQRFLELNDRTVDFYYSDVARGWWQSVWGNAHFDDLSFHICNSGRRVVTVPATIGAYNSLNWYEAPLKFLFRPGEADDKKAARLALDHLLIAAKSHGADSILIMEDMSPTATSLYRRLWPNDFTHEVLTRAHIDLTKSEAEITRAYRDNVRSYINQGLRKGLKVEATGGTASNDELVQLQNYIVYFHQQQNIPTNASSLNYALGLVGQGSGRAHICRNAESEIVGVILVIDDGSVSYYAFGAFDPACEDSASRVLLNAAILDSRRREKTTFLLAWFNVQQEVLTGRHFFGPLLDKKIKDIRTFKHGFTDTLEQVQTYRIFL